MSLIEAVNDLEFAEGDQLLRNPLPMAEKIALLKEKTAGGSVPIIDVNDNFGPWQSNFNTQVEHRLNDGVRGKPRVEKFRSGPRDNLALKPKHSGFYSTSLDVLLDYLGVQKLILCGIVGNICVLCTANDA